MTDLIHKAGMARQKRTEAELQWRRERILTASATVFQRVGYAAATMEEIAREAEYSPAALYNYFNSKAEIFVAAMEQIAERFVQTLSEPLPGGLGFEATLRFRARRMAELAFENRAILLAVEGLEGAPVPSKSSRVQECHRRAFEPWTALMATGQAEGVLSTTFDAETLAAAFISMVKGTTVSSLAQVPPPPLAELLASRDLLIDLFLNGARKGPP